jgi:hypothetical protein
MKFKSVSKSVYIRHVFAMKTNQMHYLAANYFVSQPLHVSGMFTAHHQDVFNVYVQQLVDVIRLGDWLLAGSGGNSSTLTQPAARQPKCITRTNCCIYCTPRRKLSQLEKYTSSG